MDSKFDGILITARSMSCLPHSVSNLYIKCPLLLKKKDPKWLKGTTLSERKFLWRMDLCSDYSGFQTCIVFSSEDGISFSHVLKSVREALSETVNSKQMEFTQTASRSRQMVKKNMQETSELVVYIEDLDIFSSIFYQNVNKKLPELEPIYVFYNYGQSVSFEFMKSLLSISVYSTMDICEIVVHVAYDIPAAQGHLLLWKREDVVKKIDNVHSNEYYVGGIPGYGSFTFNPTGGQRILDSKELKYLKFYASIGKFFHAQERPPFYQPIIASELLHVAVASHNTHYIKPNLGNHFQTVECVREFLKYLKKEKHYARCEMLINHPPLDSMEELLTKIENLATSLMHRLQPDSLLQHFTLLSIDYLFQSTIGICLDTIECELVKADESIKNKTIFRYPVDKFATVSVCELIICFMVRGCVVCTGNARHDDFLVKCLDLYPKRYQVALGRPELIFDAIPQVICIENGTLKFNCPRNYIPYEISSLQITPRYKYVNLIEDLKHKAKLEIAAQHVVSWIIACTVNNIVKRKRTRYTPYCKTTQQLADSCSTITFVSGFEAVKNLQLSNCSSINWVLEECKVHTMESNLFNVWEVTLGVQLEKYSLKNKKHFCLEFGHDNNCLIVVPYICLNTRNFKAATVIWMDIIEKYFRIVPNWFDKDIFKSQIEIILKRSISTLVDSQKCSLAIQQIMEILLTCTSFETIRQKSEVYEILFSNPFPVLVTLD